MNAQASIQVKADSVKVLECAYETLLSMREPKNVSEELNRIDRKLLFASVVGKFKPTERITQKFICIITIEIINNSTCRLTLVADESFGTTGACTASSYVLISDFFEQLSRNLNL